MNRQAATLNPEDPMLVGRTDRVEVKSSTNPSGAGRSNDRNLWMALGLVT